VWAVRLSRPKQMRFSGKLEIILDAATRVSEEARKTFFRSLLIWRIFNMGTVHGHQRSVAYGS
jgi:hypothetical protein